VGNIDEACLCQQGRNAAHIGLHHSVADQSEGKAGQQGIAGRIEISQKEQSARLQYPEYFCKAAALQIVGQVVDDQAADDSIEGVIVFGDLLFND